MDHQSLTVELLEARHSFPCPFTFKVIGATGTDLRARASACVQGRLGLDSPPPSTVKTASGGRHESVTLEPVCPDGKSVIDTYAALRQLKGVMFLF